MDSAFDGDVEHSFLTNLRSVSEEEWTWVPPKGRRSIGQIVHHVGACKYMYDDHAFAGGRLGWDDPLVAPPRSLAEAMRWLANGQQRLREHVAALDDAELLKPRRTNWGELYETRRIISIMISHDLYHAGEVNHLRAMRQGNDGWPGDPA